MIGFLFKMLYILVLCRVLLTAGVQTLTIDSQLGTSVEDCFERNSIGDQLPSDSIYRNVSELTNRECEQICKQDKQCQSYDYGVGAKGNATCNLSTLDEKTIKEQNPLKRHPDYDVYIRRFQCEQSPPTPIQPLSDDPGSGPQHRPVFRPEIDERPSAEDYLISGDLGYGKPSAPIYRPDDPANSKPDYDAPPSYGDHKPQDIPYKPIRPNDNYRPEGPASYRPDRPNDPYGPNPTYGSERPNNPPYGPSRPNDQSYGPPRPIDPPYGSDRPRPHDQRPTRPESNDVLQFQDINKPRPPADEYRPDPYRPEKPDYHYIIRPNRKPRPQGDYPRPDPYYDGQPSGPIGPPDRPYKPTRPYDKPTYSYNDQYASGYGQNTQNDNSLYTEIYDPPRPYIPIKDRPNQQYNGQGYLGYGTYSSQNSYSQSQNNQYYGTITEIGSYGQNDRPYVRPQKPYKPVYDDRPQKPGYGSLDDRPQKPAYGGSSGERPSSGYGLPADDRPQKPAYGVSSGERPPSPGYGLPTDDRPQKPGYGNSASGNSGYQKPNDYEKPSYNQGSHNQGYGSSQSAYGSDQVSYNTNKGSYTDKGSYSSQGNYNQGGYGNRPTNDNSNYGETGYGQNQKPNDYKPSYGSNQGSYGTSDNNQGSYGSHNSFKGSYSSSYNEQNSHQSSYGSHASYETQKPSYEQGGYGYQKPQKPYDKPYGSQAPYDSNPGGYGQGTQSSTQSSYGSSQSTYGSSSSYESNQGYGSASYGNQASSGYGQSGYGTTQSSYGSQGNIQGYGNQGSYGGHKGSYGLSQGSYGSTSHGYGSSQSYGESQYADHSTYGGYGNRPQRPAYGNDRPDYSNRPDYDYERPSYGQKPSYGSHKPGYDDQSSGYGQKPSYESQTTGYGEKPSYNDPKPGYNDPKPGYNDPKPGYNDPKPGYNDPKPGYNEPNPGYNDPKPGYNDPKPGYNDPKPGYNDPKPGYNDPKPGYGSESDYRPDVKPVYEYEMDKPNNVPAYIAGPGGEVVTSKPVVIGDYERPVYKDPGVPDKVSYKACFKRVLAGQRALRSFVRKVVPCERLEDCRRECATEKRFHCESFNYRLDPSFRGKGLCELMTKPIESFDIHRDFVRDKDYDFYEVDRNSLEPNCPETLRGPGLLHSGFLSSKDRPRLEDRPDRPNRVDGWRDRNDWGGFSYDEGRYKGNRRYQDRFVPYQIGLARTNDNQENWGQYGGVYGGSQYYKNRNDYHKSIHHWGLTSERPTYGVKHFYNDHRHLDKDRNINYHSFGNDDFDDHGKNEHKIYSDHDRTYDHHKDDGFDYHKDDRNTYDYHSISKGDFDYHSLGKDGREYHSSGEDYYGVGKAQYGNGEWKRGRWNASGLSNSLDFGNDLSKNFDEPVDRSDESNARDCFSRRRPGMSLSTGAIRRSLIVRNVVACEVACFGEKEFKCVSYSYRYSNSRGIDNCFLSERPFHGLDLSADSGSDVYGMPQEQGCSTTNQTPWIESECFYHVRSDTVVSGSAVKSTLTVAGLGACEAECIRARGFYCRGFSFRFDSPTIGEELHNCILTSLATPSLGGDNSRRAGGHELYARGNYGRGCEPHPHDVNDNGECYLQYDKAAKLTPSATRGHARVNTEQACSTACTDAPFRCLSFSYNNNAPPDTDNCLLSEIRLFDLQKDVDYVHSADDWLFAFDIFNSKCWRKVHSEEFSPEIPHPIHTSSEEDSYPLGPSGPSGPSGPGYLPDEGPSGPSEPSGPPEPSYIPGSGPPSGPGYSPQYKPPGPYKPDIYPEYRPPYKPGIRPDTDYKPAIRPETDYKPIIRPETDYKPVRPGYKPDARPDYQPVRPDYQPARPDYQPVRQDYKPARPDYQPVRPGYQPVRPDGPFTPPDRDYKPFSPRPDFRPELPGPYKPSFRPDYKPDGGFKPGFRPESRPGYFPDRPGQRPQRPSQTDREGGPLEVSWRHYTVSGFPCRAGTTCAQNHIVGHWACEPEGGEIGSWDYCCAPSHRCGYSEGFHKPWCYVGPKEDQWRPCSEKYYPYHQHNIPHPSQGHREDTRPPRPLQNPPKGYIPHWDKPPGQYLSPTDKLYWDGLYENGPSAYYDKYGNPLPGYTRVPTEDRPRIRNRYNNRPGTGSTGNWVPVGQDDPTGVPGALGAPRYWPVAYLHKSPPPNTTYFRYNETRPTTTTERLDRTTTPQPISRELPSEPRILDEPNDLDAKSSRDDKKINISKTDEVFNSDLDNDTSVNTTTEIPNIPIEKEVNISEVDAMKTENYKEIDRIDGIDDKLDDFSKSIEVLDIEDAKGDKLSDLKTLEAEERQIEAIGRLLAARRGTRLVLEKRSQKDLETKNIAVDKDLVDFNFGNRFPTSERRAERRGVIKRISKDEIERDRNIDRSLEVSETTFVRPPRVLSTTENIRKAIVNGKVFYDATIRDQRDVYTNLTRKYTGREDSPYVSNKFREQRDLYLNSTRKPKHLKRNDTNQDGTKKANLKPVDDFSSISNIKNLREERDTIHNNTRKSRRQDESVSLREISSRKSKSLRRLDDSSTPSVITNSNFGKKKVLKQRNINPVRRVRRVYRKRYNPEEVRKRLLEREKNKNSTEASRTF